MSKHRRERRAVGAAAEVRVDQETAVAKPPVRTGWRRVPTWGWALIFIVPLILSEFMFYQAGRTVNMMLFPMVWAGFWVAIWYRSRQEA